MMNSAAKERPRRDQSDHWRNFEFTSITKKAVYPALPLPEGFNELPLEDRKAWYEKFSKSDEGKAYDKEVEKAQNNRVHLPFRIETDGTFRIDDVPAGTYGMSIMVNAPPPGNQCGWGEQIGHASQEVVVPEMPTGRSDEPLEISPVRIIADKHLKVGDVAPTFTVKTLDDKDLRLEDYRGKVVLLDFWATWCGPCVAGMPQLKEAYEAFKDNDKFVMISLSLDPKPEAPRTFIEKQGIHWTQGFLGEWGKNRLTEEYGIRGIPSLWLIGPDGKIVAKDLQAPGLQNAIRAALSAAK